MPPKKITCVKRQAWSPTDSIPTGSVVSFDVGIINLAYCILNYTPGSAGAEYSVSDWNIINLADGDCRLTCTAHLKNGGKCGKKAYWTTHCLAHGRGQPGLVRNMTVENVSELELKMCLFKALDALPRLLKVDRVLIENQPLKAREKIKGIGHALFDYYVLRGNLDLKRAISVEFIDAKNKLTVYDGPPISCHLKTQYARNKWYSVKYCEYALRQHVSMMHTFWKSFKKQDDLADCFLQGAWYLKFGQHGNKGDITSTHQKLVYAANNELTYAKVRPRAPSKKSTASGKYTLANIKFLLGKKRPVDEALRNSIAWYNLDIKKLTL